MKISLEDQLEVLEQEKLGFIRAKRICLRSIQRECMEEERERIATDIDSEYERLEKVENGFQRAIIKGNIRKLEERYDSCVIPFRIVTKSEKIYLERAAPDKIEPLGDDGDILVYMNKSDPFRIEYGLAGVNIRINTLKRKISERRNRKGYFRRAYDWIKGNFRKKEVVGNSYLWER